MVAASASSALRSALDRLRPADAAMRVAGTAVAVSREARALLWQSTLMHHDLGVVCPADLESRRDLVVVMHGLFATAGALRPLRRRIERATGFATATFTYEPGCDVHTLASRLASLLGAAHAQCRVRLVGHSLGGIVARYYVQVAPRDPRVVRTVSLASPFGGSGITRWMPGFFCRDVAPNSAVLARLRRSWERGAAVPHTSIVASHDQLVWPTHSAAYQHGEVVVVEARGHNTLLFDDHVARLVADRIAQPAPVARDSRAEPDSMGTRAEAARLAG